MRPKHLSHFGSAVIHLLHMSVFVCVLFNVLTHNPPGGATQSSWREVSPYVLAAVAISTHTLLAVAPC